MSAAVEDQVRELVVRPQDFADAHNQLEAVGATIREAQVIYLAAGDSERRKLNQAFFEKLFVTDDGIEGADLASPFRQVMDDKLEETIEAENKLSPHELFTMLAETDLSYEKGDAAVSQALDVELHPIERPNGLLPVDEKNPGTYCRRRGSNVSLLAALQRQSSNQE